MKFTTSFFFILFGICLVANAQVELASTTYFPADLEFRELRTILSEESFDDPPHLAKVKDGGLILDVGFERYSCRNYSLEGSGELSIEIVVLKDSRAAYSLLTLLRSSPLQKGPPGDSYTVQAGSIRFSQDRYWIRIQGKEASDDLLKRISLSVANRIGLPNQNAPSLITHLPGLGFDASSVRYFPGLAAFSDFTGAAAVESLGIVSDAEIAQARYSINGRSGVLVLVNFPTGQVAEDYFAALGVSKSLADGTEACFAKRVGPIVAILRGSLDPASADTLLNSLRYSYSIRWIYEKKNQNKIIWGIPVSILGTVVRSLFFIAILGVVSVIAGAGFALLRFVLRNRYTRNTPDRPEEADIIRLRLR